LLSPSKFDFSDPKETEANAQNDTHKSDRGEGEPGKTHSLLPKTHTKEASKLFYHNCGYEPNFLSPLLPFSHPEKSYQGRTQVLEILRIASSLTVQCGVDVEALGRETMYVLGPELG
jgi:hypothetical protein